MCLLALALSGCSDLPEDVCSARDRDSCEDSSPNGSSACLYEPGTDSCLNRCDSAGLCPDALECFDNDDIDLCGDEDCGGIAIGLQADVCRPIE
ncbi:MAG: hypothetical protein HOW73_48825 [Polyangiaceae bacterium]|nr:hypothetical protein [Polyangiaceae bacterium]